MAEEKRNNQALRISLLIVTGYLSLSLLALYGVSRIYYEFKTFSEYESSSKERKELVLVSNLLANLYESESLNRLFFLEMQINGPVFYDSLKVVIHAQLDSLHKISSDTLMRSRLDSVSVLLDLKYKNMVDVLQLMDSIRMLPLEKKTLFTVLSQKEIDRLHQISTLHTQQRLDTTIAQVKRKSLIERLSDVFKQETVDSVLVSSNVNSILVDSLLPTQMLVDTIAQYLTTAIIDYDKRRDKFVYQLSNRQSQLFLTNEKLTFQIYDILRELEEREQTRNITFLKEKENALMRTFKTAFRVALAAMITAILFLGLSMTTLSRELRYHKHLEGARKCAEDLLRSRERLMLAISHDIKAPLSSIIGYLELLSKGRLPAKEKYYLENIQRASEHAIELVTNLLDYHRLESGKQEVKNVFFSLHRLLNDLYLEVLPLVEKKGLKFDFINKVDPTMFYHSDPFRIRQILSNLLSNAVKFTDEGTITFMAFVTSVEKRMTLTLVVKDTGHGIKEESLGDIFDVFQRVGSADIRNVEGSGLGLAITKKSVSLLNGKITVSSEENVGSEFTVAIPLKESEGRITKDANEDRKDIKILLIEDDLVLLNMFTEQLKQEGFSPVVCSHPTKALRILQQTPFDIVFSDIQMPDMNGFELVERIRSSNFHRAKTIPIIACSARSDISKQQFQEAGFSDFLMKPFVFEQVMDIIVRYANATYSAKETVSSEGFSALTVFAGKDQGAAKNILSTFVQENNYSIEKMKQALSDNDWEAIKSYAHKLSPLMHMIGAKEIVEILYALENGLKDESMVADLFGMMETKNKEAQHYLHTV